jgi:hypothetical protein
LPAEERQRTAATPSASSQPSLSFITTDLCRLAHNDRNNGGIGSTGWPSNGSLLGLTDHWQAPDRPPH